MATLPREWQLWQLRRQCYRQLASRMRFFCFVGGIQIHDANGIQPNSDFWRLEVPKHRTELSASQSGQHCLLYKVYSRSSFSELFVSGFDPVPGFCVRVWWQCHLQADNGQHTKRLWLGHMFRIPDYLGELNVLVANIILTSSDNFRASDSSRISNKRHHSHCHYVLLFQWLFVGIFNDYSASIYKRFDCAVFLKLSIGGA